MVYWDSSQETGLFEPGKTALSEIAKRISVHRQMLIFLASRKLLVAPSSNISRSLPVEDSLSSVFFIHRRNDTDIKIE